VRNVRSDGAGGGGFGGFYFGRWIIGAAVGVMLAVAGCCGSGMWRMGGAIRDAQHAMEEAQLKFEEDRKLRTVVVAAKDLLDDFQHDADAADKKYKGKFLELSGIVERRGKSAHGAHFLILHGGDQDAAIKIECFMIFIDPKKDDRPLEPGQAVTVRGEYLGRVSHVQLHSCTLVK
jgi:hypothetical protein